jgi:pyridoxamine 5'-phosphate oxidase
MENLANIRKDYSKATLDGSSIEENPVSQFEKWFAEALKAKVPEPNAMNLSTVNEKGKPSARIVLLKGLENNQFVFYTNYQSQKGKELDNNPACALTFFWPELERQVRIEGVTSRVDPEKSDLYFQTRPRESQLGAWASPQSGMIKDRTILEQRLKEMEKKFQSQKTLPRPKQWGGYQIDPLQIEFWQGRPGRLHDRIQYVKVDNKWKIYRLAP